MDSKNRAQHQALPTCPGQVKSGSHLPELAGKISPKKNAKPLLNVSDECLGQVRLEKDLPDCQAVTNHQEQINSCALVSQPPKF